MTNDRLVREWIETDKDPPICKAMKPYRTHVCVGDIEDCLIETYSEAYMCTANIFKSQFVKRRNIAKRTGESV